MSRAFFAILARGVKRLMETSLMVGTMVIPLAFLWVVWAQDNTEGWIFSIAFIVGVIATFLGFLLIFLGRHQEEAKRKQESESRTQRDIRDEERFQELITVVKALGQKDTPKDTWKK